jgi:dipeptidyl aminopeptidase/acylaminoacyl peptidase
MTRPLSLDDIEQLRMVGEVDLSPDGSTAAFVLARYDLANDATTWQVHTLPTDGSQAEPTKVTDGAHDSVPRFSPDGRSLSYLAADEHGRAQLQLLDLASGDVRTIGALPRGVQTYAWAPDGTGFAVVGGPPYPENQKHPGATQEELRAAYGDRIIHVTRLGQREYSGWADDEPAQLWWVPLDGAAVMVTDGVYPVQSPGFHPDGRLTFVSPREEGWDAILHATLWAVPRTGGEPEPLTKRVNTLRGHAVLDDGTVAYVALAVEHICFGSSNTRLWVNGEDVTGHLDRAVGRVSEVQSLTLDYLNTATEVPVVGPGGDDLWFNVVDAGSAHIYRWYDGEVRPVLTGRRIIGDFAVRGGRIAFTQSSPDNAITLRIADIDGTNERVLFDPNPWFGEREVGELRHFTVQTPDGDEIDAWVTLPARWDGTPLPAFFELHPGPHSSLPWDYRLEHRLLSQEGGLAVLSCNQIGSQGYGEKFLERHDGHWGEADEPQLIAVLDEAIRLGYVDGERVGLGGLTYGGFAALWMLTHQQSRFKAAVINRAISDLHAGYADMDIGWLFNPAAMGGVEPWEDPEIYRRLSPVTLAHTITAPTRFLAFATNGRTTVAAAEAIYIRLKKLGVPTDMLVFPAGTVTVFMPNRPYEKRRMIEAHLEWFDR